MLGPQVGTHADSLLLTCKFLDTGLVPNKSKQPSKQILLNQCHEHQTNTYLSFETWADSFPGNLVKIKYLLYLRNSFFLMRKLEREWKSDLHGKEGINIY